MGSRNEEGGDVFLTKEEAGDILDKSPRTIHRYIEKGWLEPVFKGRNIGTTRDSVYKLKEELEREVNPYKVSIQTLEARLMVAESRIGAMMRLLNMRNEPLRLTDPEMKSFYDMVELCSRQGWPPHNEEMLIDSFMRMDEDALEQCEKIVGDEHPWRPFLMLAGTMRAAIFNRALQTDIDLAASHLNVLAHVWCRRKGETTKTFDLLVARDASPLKKLLNRLNRDRPKSQVPGEA